MTNEAMAMTPELEARIRAVYPTGNDWEADKSNLDWAARRAAADSLGSLLSQVSIRVEGDCCWEVVAPFTITDADGPSFESWMAVNNPGKLKYLSEYGEPFVVLWLKLSLVDRYYMRYFNAWRPRGDTGYLDIDICESPSEKWRQRLTAIDRALHDAGFKLLSHEEGMQDVPFIMNLGYDHIPDSDPRWDDEDFAPPRVPSTVYNCLFGDPI